MGFVTCVYIMATNERQTHGLTWIYHFIYTTYNSLYRKVVAKVVKIVVVLDLLFGKKKNLTLDINLNNGPPECICE